MAGGIIQLVAVGSQDEYLTKNPEVTYFKKAFRRYTNFAIEAIEQTFTGTVDFGRSFNCTISRNADLVHKAYFEVTLPTITATSGNVAWTRHVGLNLIKSVEVMIGGQTIDKHYGMWMIIWNELTQTSEKMDGFNVMIGNTTGLTTPASTIPGQKLYIPLLFWFCRHPGQSLPLIALQYHDVKISFELRSITDLVIGNLSGSPSLGSANLWLDFIYLDNAERTQFAQTEHQYLIEILQYAGGESVNATSFRNKMPYNHPTKELCWVVQLDANVASGANRWSDFTASGTTTNKFYNGADPVVDCCIQINGQDRFKRRDAGYFNIVQPYQHHTRCPATGVYSYSFALDPEDFQPSGTINLSRVDNTSLSLTMASNAASQLHVFALSYNILKIASGMGGSVFAN